MEKQVKVSGDAYAYFINVLWHRHTDVYFFDDKQHHVPHIHVEYADSKAVINI
jgi:hypothetical protein